jgi:alkylation response protein AidB-like acyl-CoA dehydrogenase
VRTGTGAGIEAPRSPNPDRASRRRALDQAVSRATAVAERCAANAAALDQAGAFPTEEFRLLAEAGLLAAPLRREDGGLGLGTEQGRTAALLDVLRQLGRGNLSVGRIYEGHANALQLIQTFGTEPQVRACAREVLEEGRLFGVWNTQADDGVRLEPLPGGRYRLEGAKTFASGAGHVERPLVSGALPDGGWQLCLVPLEAGPARVEADWWQPLGMRASVSARVDFGGIEVGADALIGAPGDYHRQPWLTLGAVRFAAVQVGGAEALLDATRAYLRRGARADDPYQRTRVAEMALAVEGGNLWLRGAAALVDRCAPFFEPGDRSGASPDPSTDLEPALAYANLVRSAVERLCLEVLERTERAVGARGLLRPWPFERLIRDLRHYLRQPAPDAALAEGGRFLLEREAPFGALWADAP